MNGSEQEQEMLMADFIATKVITEQMECAEDKGEINEQRETKLTEQKPLKLNYKEIELEKKEKKMEETTA